MHGINLWDSRLSLCMKFRRTLITEAASPSEKFVKIYHTYYTASYAAWEMIQELVSIISVHLWAIS
jgi:hypothetical protein